MKSIKLFLILSLLQFSLFGQLTQTIRGRIVDRDSKQPLFGANIAVMNVDPIMGSTSHESGYFRIENVPVMRVDIRITFIGYEEIILTNVDLNSSRETVLQIEMNESVILMKEVIITADQDKNESINQMATLSARTFSIEESQRYAGSLNDVSRMAQNFAGVGMVNDQRNDLIIRGNSALGVLYRLEGVDIPNPNHFSFQGSTGGPISILNNNVLSNSDFFTGAFPAEYGNAYAGAFDLHLRNGNDEKTEILGQIGFNGAELMIEGPFNKRSRASYLVNYRYSTLELFKRMGIEFGTVAVPHYQDGNFHVNLPDKKGHWDLFGLGGYSTISFLDSEKKANDNYFDDAGEDLYYTTYMAAIGLSRTQYVGNSAYFKTTFSYNLNGREIINDTLSDTDKTPYNVFSNQNIEGKYSCMMMFNKKINAQHTLRIGSFNDLLFFKYNERLWLESQNTYFNRSDFNGTTPLFQPYIQHQYRFNEKLFINSGLHSIIFPLNRSWTLEPRIGVKYKQSAKQTFGLAYGRHAQLPPMLLYFRKSLSSGGNTLYRNRELGPLYSDHFVASFDRMLAQHTRIKLETYFQFLQKVPIDSAYSNYSILNQGSNFDFSYPLKLVNKGLGKNYGIELTLERFMHKGFYYLFTASLYESYYRASDSIWYNTAFNGNYAFTLLSGKEWNLTRKQSSNSKLKLLIDARMSYRGGQRFTPLDATKSQLFGYAIYNENEHLKPRYPDYFRPDLRIAIKWSKPKFSQEWAFDLQNIINRKNIFSRDYSPSLNELVDKYQLGFLPVFLYRIYL